MELYETLEIRPGLTAIIGGGGKTTLLYHLGQELSRHARVILCTTTNIAPPEHIPCLTDATPAAISQALDAGGQVCVGTLTELAKLRAPAFPMAVLLALADYVLVEADGSARLPLKAHAAHEPVIPAECQQVIAVVGLDGIGKPIQKVAHRPARYAALAGCTLEDTATAGRAARVLLAEGLHHRVLLNKVELPNAADAARALAAQLACPAVCSSLHRGEWRCL